MAVIGAAGAVIIMNTRQVMDSDLPPWFKVLFVLTMLGIMVWGVGLYLKDRLEREERHGR